MLYTVSLDTITYYNEFLVIFCTVLYLTWVVCGPTHGIKGCNRFVLSSLLELAVGM